MLSSAHPSLFQYFKQLFAQVTNPPIDAIRESLVTDTAVYVGADGNLLVEKPENCAVLKIDQPDIDLRGADAHPRHEKSAVKGRDHLNAVL